MAYLHDGRKVAVKVQHDNAEVRFAQNKASVCCLLAPPRAYTCVPPSLASRTRHARTRARAHIAQKLMRQDIGNSLVIARLLTRLKVDTFVDQVAALEEYRRVVRVRGQTPVPHSHRLETP